MEIKLNMQSRAPSIQKIPIKIRSFWFCLEWDQACYWMSKFPFLFVVNTTHGHAFVCFIHWSQYFLSVFSVCAFFLSYLVFFLFIFYLRSSHCLLLPTHILVNSSFSNNTQNCQRIFFKRKRFKIYPQKSECHSWAV